MKQTHAILQIFLYVAAAPNLDCTVLYVLSHPPPVWLGTRHPLVVRIQAYRVVSMFFEDEIQAAADAFDIDGDGSDYRGVLRGIDCDGIDSATNSDVDTDGLSRLFCPTSAGKRRRTERTR